MRACSGRAVLFSSIVPLVCLLRFFFSTVVIFIRISVTALDTRDSALIDGADISASTAGVSGPAGPISLESESMLLRNSAQCRSVVDICKIRISSGT